MTVHPEPSELRYIWEISSQWVCDAVHIEQAAPLESPGQSTLDAEGPLAIRICESRDAVIVLYTLQECACL